MRSWQWAVVLAGGLVVAACSSPRARPVPPVLRLTFDTAHVVQSPGSIVGSLYAYDADGLDFLRLSLTSADSQLAMDSLIGLPGEAEATYPITWFVPAGLPPGTTLKFRASITDFVAFETADSALFMTRP